MRKTLIPLAILTIFLLVFFSFRLASTPNGINTDEAAYGYNGILLSNFLHDSHGRFMPIFILGSDNTWYPPYMQYLVAALFRVLGPSVYAMRFASVIITTASALLTLYFVRNLIGKAAGIVALAAFVIIPEVMIETHTPLEHMIVVPFVLLWLIALFKYRKTFKEKYLAFAALSLGIGFYSYAGIRPFIVVWSLITIAYIIYLKPKVNKHLRPVAVFCLTGLPFALMIPVFEHYYSGAVLNHAHFEINSIYRFFYYYLASFDPSFLFVTGDKLQIQSTLKHGMFLLSTLPLFAVGLYQTFRKKSDYFKLLGITFLVSPILLGLIGSVYFAHRLTYMIPFYVVFTTLGVMTVMSSKSRLIIYASLGLLVLVAINYADFWKYYMYVYPKDTYHIFYHLSDYDKPYIELSNAVKESGLTPYISSEIANKNTNGVELFVRALYFPKEPGVLEKGSLLPENGVLLSSESQIKGLVKLDPGNYSSNLFVLPDRDSNPN